MYKFLDECKKCVPGYYLSSPQYCAPVIKIDRCISYDGADYKVNCLECAENYYLRDINYCEERQNEIDKCEIYAI